MIKYMYKNLITLTVFQLFFNLLTYSIISPLSKWLFKISIFSSGLTNLTQCNFFKYITNPIAIIIDLFIFFIITITTLLYFNALVIIFISSKNHKSITIFSLIIAMFKSSKETLKLRNVSMFLYIVFALPYINFVYKNPVIKDLSIPPFMINSINDNNYYLIILFILTFLIIVYVINNSYVFFYMLTQNQKYGVARLSSKKLVKKTYKKLFIAIIKIIIMASIISAICLFFQYLFYLICTKINEGLMFKFVTACFSILIIINSTIYHIVTNVYGTYMFGNIYFENEKLFDIKINYDITYFVPKWIKVLLASVIIIILGFTGGLFFYGELRPDVAVIAHRGASVEELENTKESFLRAQLDGANVIELDVFLSKDNQVVIIHDSNLSRLAGIDKNINELTYNELKDINISNYDGSKTGSIMLLKDLLPLIVPDVKLLIEIKPFDGNGNLCADKVEKLLAFYPRHMIGCFDINVINQVKKNNPLRKTVYFLAFAYGDWDDFDSVDVYALEESFLDRKNIKLIHKKNREVYVWSINDLNKVYYLLELNIDGILTDIPSEVLSIVNGSQLKLKKQMLFEFFTKPNNTYNILLNKIGIILRA